MCASSELQLGALREGGGTREAGSTVAESLVVLYRVGTHQIRRRRRAARSLTSHGKAEPLCARIKGANREVSEGKLMSDHCRHFSSCKGHKERRTGKIRGAFKNAQGFGRLDAGSRAGFTSSRDLGISISLIFVRYVALRNLDLLIKTGWCPVCC